MKDFIATAEKQEKKKGRDEKNAITFKHHGTDVKFYKPGEGKIILLLAMARRDMDKKAAGTFISLFFEMMDEETQRYFENRLMDDEDDFSLGSEGGIFDIWEELAKEWSDNPTQERSGSQKSRSRTGTSSTGSTRAKGSTSTSSRSRASSR